MKTDCWFDCHSPSYWYEYNVNISVSAMSGNLITIGNRMTWYSLLTHLSVLMKGINTFPWEMVKALLRTWISYWVLKWILQLNLDRKLLKLTTTLFTTSNTESFGYYRIFLDVKCTNCDKTLICKSKIKAAVLMEMNSMKYLIYIGCIKCYWCRLI
jgi:hypothetical protein